VTTTHFRSCTLCEATCGVAIEVDGDRVISIRGDDADPFSKGYICPKATALADLHHDPDRLTKPMRRDGDRWHELEWDEALELVAGKLRAIRKRHGANAVAVYQGNPTAHNLGLLTYGQLLFRTLGTRNMYSATSLDQLPHMLAALQMFGHQLLMPVPDIDRTELFICLGANPLTSNGSIMTAPDVKSRLKAIRDRGGRVIVLDPRRTETAERADRHLFIRPATDAVLLLAMIHVLFAENRVRLGRLQANGVEELRLVSLRWTPERAAEITGVASDDIRDLARALAITEKAVLYGRIGVCVQEFGGLATWLCYAVNALTGHLDEPGGLMFTTPAIDPLPLASLLGFEGGFARWTSRVSGKPEFGGELPMTAFVEEITTPGEGQIRALITCAGNPALSAPGGRELEHALDSLELMVSIDPYLNETTRHAHVILPPTSPLARSHYDLALFAFAVRNVAKYSPALFQRRDDERDDWEICLALLTRLRLPSIGARLAERMLGPLGPEAVLEAALRIGPYGLRKGRNGLSLRKLRDNPHGIDLGALESRLPARLGTRDKKVHLAPTHYLNDLPRLDRRFERADSGLVMVGRRHLRSNNSWMHEASSKERPLASRRRVVRSRCRSRSPTK
jgi:anaerobic selenocysteine-containing dehydrogenase